MLKTNHSQSEISKAAAAKTAVEYIQPGMRVGLGTGSTAAYFIDFLGKKCQEGLLIEAVCSSIRSQEQAQKLGIPLQDIEKVTSLDITVDGADEVDSKKQLIKGGGGALLREKIVASMSKSMIVIVDESKIVDHLGLFPLPIEIVPFGYRATIAKLNDLGYIGHLRITKNHEIYQTDNGNYIYDIHLEFPCLNPEKENRIIRSVVGVIETGFFLNLASQIIVGYPDGQVEIRS
jgi:ribose 5-phosphate isomerase A